MSSAEALWDAADRLLTNRPFSRLVRGGFDFLGGIVGGEEPSKYSRSPDLWNGLFSSLGLRGIFLPLDLPPEADFFAFSEAFLALPGCVDFTVTNPYKAKAYEYLLESEKAPRNVEIAPAVRHLGCLNHIMKAGNGWAAGNTDGAGLVRALKKRRTVRGLRVLLVGAGGAATSVAYELLAEGAFLVIANIEAEDARRLAAGMNALGLTGQVCRSGGWDLIEAEAAKCGCLVSAITFGSPLAAAAIKRLADDVLLVDIRYGKGAEFAREVRSTGRPVVDGREMLFGQFALAAAEIRRGGGFPGIAAGRLEGVLEEIEERFYSPPTNYVSSGLKSSEI